MLTNIDIRWWCAAVSEPWSGAWRAYPGVWLVTLLVAWAARPRGAGAPRTVAWGCGVALLWLALDWPLGALGAGYLATAHAFQFLLLAMVVPPLVLRGVSPATAGAVARAMPRPFVAMVAFTVVMVVTHVPSVVDPMMRTAWGAFTLDMAWLGSGLAFWWPVTVSPRTDRTPLTPPMQILYLFFGTVAHLFIAMWLSLAEFPVYATYELAPPTGWFSPLVDQQLAGGVLLLVGGPYVLAVISVIFFRWFAREERASTVPRAANA